MSWLLPRLRPGAALRLGAGRHALPTLRSSTEAVAGPSSLQGPSDVQAPHAAPSRQQLRCLSDGSQATKPAASPEEGALHRFYPMSVPLLRLLSLRCIASRIAAPPILHLSQQQNSAGNVSKRHVPCRGSPAQGPVAAVGRRAVAAAGAAAGGQPCSAADAPANLSRQHEPRGRGGSAAAAALHPATAGRGCAPCCGCRCGTASQRGVTAATGGARTCRGAPTRQVVAMHAALD